jgi:hypothetical protein
MFSQKRAAILIGIVLLLVLLTRSRPRVIHHTIRNNYTTFKDSRWDKFAIGVKTGIEIAIDRAPIQLVTFLQPCSNVVFISDYPGTVGAHHFFPVLHTALYKRSQERRDANRRDTTRRSQNVVEQVIPNEKSTGWKSDTHKNLPGFDHLYTKFPNADWYIMIDDDTFLFLENLEEYLAPYDPSQPFFFGSANKFKGCDGVKRLGDGPLFAHGGSGIILSRGALQKMIPIIPQCIKKYEKCWAGDIKIGLCLRDIQVLMTPGGSFNKDPPHQEFSFPWDPCTKPITFHHLLGHQIQSLYDLELQQEKQVTFADVFRAWHGHNDGKVLKGDRQKSAEYKHFATKNADECKEACAEDKECRSWTFTGDQCWLKRALAKMQLNSSFQTGHFSSHYVCKK